jgi:hypothetical protein
MAKQLKWGWELCTANQKGEFNIVSTLNVTMSATSLNDYLEQELNDVHPLLVKIVNVQDSEYYVFHPFGLKELHQYPEVGSTNRWTRIQNTFPTINGLSFKDDIADYVVSILDNLDPHEAMYAKVSCIKHPRDHGNLSMPVTVIIIIPEGAK